MKKVFIIILLTAANLLANAQSPVGRWKCIEHYTIYEGKKIEMHKALNTQRPCTKNIVFEFKTDGKANRIYQGCDESYVSMQSKLWKNWKWKTEGKIMKTTVTDFQLSNDYTISFSGNKMTWTNKDEIIVYQKI